MPLSKAKKGELIEKAKKVLESAKTVVFVNFHGLSAGNTLKLRHELKKENIGYLVAKKTLLKRALDEKKPEGDMPELTGEVALAYGDDLLAPAREVHRFGKGVEGALSIIGGIFEGAYKGKDEMLAIATIPSRETLYAQFANLMNSPLSRLAVALGQVAEKKGTASA